MIVRSSTARPVIVLRFNSIGTAEARQREPLVRPPPDSILGRVSASKQVVHITDVREVQSYIERNPFMVAGVELGGYRTVLGVPMLNQGALIGVVSIYRQEVRPFTDKQISLVQNFAAQAVIAIENTRLLNELQQRTADLSESLEQQTATSEVLKVVSSSPGELEPVFETMLENAVRICDAKFGTLQLREDGAFRVVAMHVRLLDELRQSLQQQTATADVLKIISRSTFDLRTVLQTLVESAARLCDADKATITRERDGAFYSAEAYGFSREFMDYIKNIPIEPERGSASGRALLEGRVIHIPDVNADPEYTWVETQRRGDYRTILCVPMLRESIPIGVLILTRSEARPFTDKQIELVTTFADQAAIAIENVRLFDEIQDKGRQLEEASQHKSQFLANMSHELRTPLNAILGYTELMTDGAYGEPSEKMLGILKRLEANGKHLLGLINDVLDLSKIEAGQLVLELSDYSVQDIAQTVRSTLEPLAADKKLAFKVEVVPDLPPGRGDGRRLTQVLINLVGNAIKFTDAGEVAIKAEANNGSFYVSVRDTGPGISAADQAKLFQEFQQADNTITRKKGGTGLGLAISKRIIEMHGGKIWVELQPGQGSTFAFTLPVIVERQAEPA